MASENNIMQGLNQWLGGGIVIKLSSEGLIIRPVTTQATVNSTTDERLSANIQSPRRHQPPVDVLADKGKTSIYYRDYHIALNVMKNAMRHFVEAGRERITRKELTGQLMIDMDWSASTANRYITRAVKYGLLDIVDKSKYGFHIYRVAIPVDELKQTREPKSQQNSERTINFDSEGEEVNETAK